MAKTETYDAQAEYMKDIAQKAGPRNVPANLMSRIRAASLSQLVAGAEDSSMISGLSGSLLQWNSFSKLEKIERIAGLELGEVKALMSNEDDDDVLVVLLNRKREIEKQRKE
jgi:hypothetical protein